MRHNLFYRFRHGILAEVFVCNNVPAEVCDLCGDTLLAPVTIRRLEVLMASGRPADRFAPLYDYA